MGDFIGKNRLEDLGGSLIPHFPPLGRQLSEQVQFTLDAGPIKDIYTLAYDWYPDHGGVSWTLVKGQMQRAQKGSYALVPSGDSTQVTYTLAVQLAIPLLGLLRRKAEKVIMDTALKELKRRVETGGS